MTQTVHAHQVLNLLDQQSAPITLDALRAQVDTAYGNDAVFTNCHEDHFSFDQLLDFMTQRQKIVVANGSVRLNKANVCDH